MPFEITFTWTGEWAWWGIVLALIPWISFGFAILLACVWVSDHMDGTGWVVEPAEWGAVLENKLPERLKWLAMVVTLGSLSFLWPLVVVVCILEILYLISGRLYQGLKTRALNGD